MAQAWPGTLPDYFLAGSYSESPRNQVLRSEVDVGVAITRRRYTSFMKDATGRMRMTKDQLDILDSFFNIELAGGSLSFDLVDPLTLTSYEYKMKNVYKANHVGYNIYDIDFELEILP